MTRDELILQILDCERCELHAQCTLPVPFTAPEPAAPGGIMIIGEAPGEEEDKAGRPFIGPAGQLLRRLLERSGIDPNSAFIANTVCCFPHSTPSWDHVRSCAKNKRDQIELADPKHILLLGGVALRAVRVDLNISKSRGRPFLHRDRICFASFHPAAALRNHKYERGLKNDLDTFSKLIVADNWGTLIPDDCALCDEDAEYWDNSGLGWCANHIPDNAQELWDNRRRQQIDELDAARRRDVALAQVADAADPSWMAAAWDALNEYLRTHETFFVDDFWNETKLERPKESRALGPVVLRAARDGLMKKSGQFRKSAASNMTEKPLWTSLVYVRPGA